MVLERPATERHHVLSLRPRVRRLLVLLVLVLLVLVLVLLVLLAAFRVLLVVRLRPLIRPLLPYVPPAPSSPGAPADGQRIAIHRTTRTGRGHVEVLEPQPHLADQAYLLQQLLPHRLPDRPGAGRDGGRRCQPPLHLAHRVVEARQGMVVLAQQRVLARLLDVRFDVS